MKILSRISIKPSVDEYPYKAPDNVLREAKALLVQVSQYCIQEELMLLLIPIDTEEYKWVKAFIAINEKYFTSHLELFERKFSKGEISTAEFLILRVANIVYSSSENDNFDYCCEDRCFRIGMNSKMRIESKSMKNKDLGFSTDYRFVISEQGYHIYDSNYKNQLTIPREISSDLLDFNASFELFSELGAREYIISKKMYSIFKESGIRALDCEPVRIS